MPAVRLCEREKKRDESRFVWKHQMEEKEAKKKKEMVRYIASYSIK
jgi:hypothetical protein